MQPAMIAKLRADHRIGARRTTVEQHDVSDPRSVFLRVSRHRQITNVKRWILTILELNEVTTYHFAKVLAGVITWLVSAG